MAAHHPAAAILIVEDHADSALALLRLLTLARFEPVVAYSAGEALQCLSLSVPAAIVLDCNLPDMHGLDMLEAVRADARTRHLLVIVNTAEDSPERRTRATGLGVGTFIVKNAAAWDAVVTALHEHVGDPVLGTGRFSQAG